MLPSREPVPFIFFFFLSFLFYNEIPTKMAQKWYTRNENCRKPGTRLSYPRKEFLNFRKLHKEKKNRRQISKNINTMIDLLQHSLRKSHTFIRNTDTFFSPHLRESMRISKEMWPRTLSAFSRYYLTFGISYLVSRRVPSTRFDRCRSFVYFDRLGIPPRFQLAMELCACQKYQFARESGNSLLDLARHRFKSEINLSPSLARGPPREPIVSRPLSTPFYALTSSLRAKSSADIDRLNESLRRILIKAFSKTLPPRGWWTAI